jgi:hypothetical protein
MGYGEKRRAIKGRRSLWMALIAVSILSSMALVALQFPRTPAVAQGDFCGERPTDWCPAPAGDPCGRHRNAVECRADSRCYGMPYRGESVVACMLDDRGFASNCPTVGCTSTPPPAPRR